MDRPQILVVDDEPLNTKLVEAHLSPLGYDIIVSRNGEDALDKISSGKIDLVLLDVMLPGINGFEVCRQIRKKYHQTIPVILLTTLYDIPSKVTGFEWGADDFLTKPFNKDELIARVRAHLRIKTMMDELEELSKTLEEKVVQRTRTIEKMNRELSDSCHLTMESLVGALDVREHETSRHSLRVAFDTVEIAKAWGISGQELEEIAMGALLHDVGKIGISDNILLKPGKLTDEEWEQMRKHVEMGWKIVKGIKFMGRGRELVRSHHERYDGRGYPRGLKNEEIYIGARFFAIADTLDSMTNDRPYRRALSFEAFLEELRKCSGSQFDPDAVEKFLSMPRDVWFQIARRADYVDFNKLISVIHQKSLEVLNF
jgi:putative two-component system response regulator